MLREPAEMRRLPWSDRARLRNGAAPRTPLEVQATEAYAEWLHGPGFAVRVISAPLGWLIAALAFGTVQIAVAGALTAAAVSLGLTLWTRTRVDRHVDPDPTT